MDSIIEYKNICGFSRYMACSDGSVISNCRNRSKTIKPFLSPKGYYYITMTNDFGKRETHMLHQIIAVAFLDHKINGMSSTINHKNEIKTDNRPCNLEIVSNRYNCSYSKKNKTSKYSGVHWNKRQNVWSVRITVDYKGLFIGNFKDEEEANIYYKNAVAAVENGTEIIKKPVTKKSKYVGVSWNKKLNKWFSQSGIGGNRVFLGYYTDEYEAKLAYDKYITK